MLNTIRHTVKNNVTFGRIVTGAATVIMSASLIAPAMAAQQNEKETRELSQSTGLHHEQLGVYESIVRSRLEKEAQQTLSSAQAVVTANEAKTDASAAKLAIAGLGTFSKLDDSALRKSIDGTKAAADALSAAGAEADRKAAEAAAAAAAAKAAAEAAAAQAAAEAAAAANTPDSAKSVAASIASSQYGWGSDQFSCLSSLWAKESGWNYQAYNAGSGATGIPQALPGSKMASFGSDWATNATTQIKWGLDYIARSYGSPCSAWSHSQAVNWY
jgi:membrane protein involved in colicin uptake